MKSIYIETTIPSFATSRPSRDLILAGQQTSTMLLWEKRSSYDLYISDYVIDECSQGDPEIARRRLKFLAGITVIPKSEKIQALGNEYQQLLRIPERAKADCFHLAACVVTETDYLLTWNCKHLGIHTFVKLREYNEENGLFTPLLITPEELLQTDQRGDKYGIF